MKRFFERVLQVGLIAGATLEGVLRRIERLFHSKEEMSRRSTGRFETLKRKQMEIERLDRLRNPRDYQGK